MLSDGFFERVGVIRRAVTHRAHVADINPRSHRGQVQNVGLDRFWQSVQRCGVVHVANTGYRSNILIVKTVGEGLHLINLRRTCDALSTLAIRHKNRNASADDAFEIDFGEGAVLVADDHRGPRNVLHACVFYPEFVGELSIDGNCRGDVLELRTDQRQAGLALSDRRFTLPLKRGIDHRKLPSWGRPPSPDAVLAPVKMDVLCDVATIVNSRES